jgi:hypothetical protein
MEFLVICGISLGLTIFIAKKKNRNPLLWGALSLLLLIFVPIILAILPKVNGDDELSGEDANPEPVKPVSGVKKFSLYVACFVVVSGVLGNMLYQEKASSDEILKDPIYASANIGKIEEKEKFKKGVSIKSYKINYDFTDKGREYSGSFTVSNDYISQYKDKRTIDIAYLKSNPVKNKLKTSLDSEKTTEDWIGLFGKFALFCLAVSLLPFGLLAYSLGWIQAK